MKTTIEDLMRELLTRGRVGDDDKKPGSRYGRKPYPLPRPMAQDATRVDPRAARLSGERAGRTSNEQADRALERNFNRARAGAEARASAESRAKEDAALRARNARRSAERALAGETQDATRLAPARPLPTPRPEPVMTAQPEAAPIPPPPPPVARPTPLLDGPIPMTMAPPPPPPPGMPASADPLTLEEEELARQGEIRQAYENASPGEIAAASVIPGATFGHLGAPPENVDLTTGQKVGQLAGTIGGAIAPMSQIMRGAAAAGRALPATSALQAPLRGIAGQATTIPGQVAGDVAGGAIYSALSPADSWQEWAANMGIGAGADALLNFATRGAGRAVRALGRGSPDTPDLPEPGTFSINGVRDAAEVRHERPVLEEAASGDNVGVARPDGEGVIEPPRNYRDLEQVRERAEAHGDAFRAAMRAAGYGDREAEIALGDVLGSDEYGETFEALGRAFEATGATTPDNATWNQLANLLHNYQRSSLDEIKTNDIAQTFDVDNLSPAEREAQRAREHRLKRDHEEWVQNTLNPDPADAWRGDAGLEPPERSESRNFFRPEPRPVRGEGMEGTINPDRTQSGPLVPPPLIGPSAGDRVGINLSDVEPRPAEPLSPTPTGFTPRPPRRPVVENLEQRFSLGEEVPPEAFTRPDGSSYFRDVTTRRRKDGDDVEAALRGLVTGEGEMRSHLAVIGEDAAALRAAHDFLREKLPTNPVAQERAELLEQLIQQTVDRPPLGNTKGADAKAALPQIEEQARRMTVPVSPDAPRAQRVNRMLQNLNTLAEDFMGRAGIPPEMARDWYSGAAGVERAIMRLVQPERKSDAVHVISTAVHSILSNGQQVVKESDMGQRVVEQWLRTGNLSMLDPELGEGVTTRVARKKSVVDQPGMRGRLTGGFPGEGGFASPKAITHEVNLRRLQDLVDRMGIEGAADHIVGTGAYRKGKANATELFGPKIGQYMNDKLGVPSEGSTIDLWMARLYHILTGKAPPTNAKGEISDTVSDKMRSEMQEVLKAYADQTGAIPSSAQAVAWYVVKDFFRQAGMKEKAGAYDTLASAARRNVLQPPRPVGSDIAMGLPKAGQRVLREPTPGMVDQKYEQMKLRQARQRERTPGTFLRGDPDAGTVEPVTVTGGRGPRRPKLEGDGAAGDNVARPFRETPQDAAVRQDRAEAFSEIYSALENQLRRVFRNDERTGAAIEALTSGYWDQMIDPLAIQYTYEYDRVMDAIQRLDFSRGDLTPERIADDIYAELQRDVMRASGGTEGTLYSNPLDPAAIRRALATPEGRAAARTLIGAAGGAGADALVGEDDSVLEGALIGALGGAAGPAAVRGARRLGARGAAGGATATPPAAPATGTGPSLTDEEIAKILGQAQDEIAAPGPSSGVGSAPATPLANVGPVDPDGVNPDDYVNIGKIVQDPTGQERLRAEVQRMVADAPDLAPKEVVTWKKQIADSLGLDAEDVLTDPSKVADRQHALAARNLIKTNLEQITRIERSLNENAVMPEDAREKLFQLRNALEVQNLALLDRFTRARSEAGRTLNSYKILANRTFDPNDPVPWLAKAKTLAGGDYSDDVRVEVMRYLGKGDKQGLFQYLSKLRRANLGEKGLTLWKAGMLTNPLTHIVNITGNTGEAGLRTLAQNPVAMVDWLLSKKTGMRTQSFLSRQMIAASARGALEGVKEAGKVMQGIPLNDALEKWDIPRDVNFDNAVLQVYTQTVFRLLGAQDRIFRSIALQASLANQAEVMARSAGLKGAARKAEIERLIKAPTDAMTLRAIEDAERATFTNETAASQMVKGMTAQNADRWPKKLQGVGKVAKTVGSVVVPFQRTPAALGTRMVELSPLGTAKGAWDVARILLGTVPEADIPRVQREAARRLGESTTAGLSLVLTGYLMHKAGRATGSFSRTDEEAGTTYQEQVPRNAFKYGDTWYEVGRLGPPGMMFALGANIAAGMETGVTPGEKAAKSAAGASKILLDQPMLQGMKTVMDATSNPGTMGARYLNSLAGSAVPAVVAAAVRANDPNVYEVDGPVDAVRARAGVTGAVPSLGLEAMEPRRTPLGDKMERDTGLSSMLSPLRQSKDQLVDDPVLQVLNEYGVPVAPVSKVKGEKAAERAVRQGDVGAAVRRQIEMLTGDEPPPPPERPRGRMGAAERASYRRREEQWRKERDRWQDWQDAEEIAREVLEAAEDPIYEGLTAADVPRLAQEGWSEGELELLLYKGWSVEDLARHHRRLLLQRTISGVKTRATNAPERAPQRVEKKMDKLEREKNRVKRLRPRDPGGDLIL